MALLLRNFFHHLDISITSDRTTFTGNMVLPKRFWTAWTIRVDPAELGAHFEAYNESYGQILTINECHLSKNSRLSHLPAEIVRIIAKKLEEVLFRTHLGIWRNRIKCLGGCSDRAHATRAEREILSAIDGIFSHQWTQPSLRSFGPAWQPMRSASAEILGQSWERHNVKLNRLLQGIKRAGYTPRVRVTDDEKSILE